MPFSTFLILIYIYICKNWANNYIEMFKYFVQYINFLLNIFQIDLDRPCLLWDLS